MPISYRAAQKLIKRGDEDGLRSALETGLDPNLANQNGWTLLMLAAVEGNASLGELLLSKGAARNARNRNDETAAQLASQKGHAAMLTLLQQSDEAHPSPE